MACIYHIYSTGNDKLIYIGQTKLSPEPRAELEEQDDQPVMVDYQARPMDHFSGLFDAHENKEFMNFIRTYPLKTMVVEIYSDSDYFGLSPKILDDFCQKWFGDKIDPSVKTYGDVLKLSPDDKQRQKWEAFYLDAAEIIHNYIAYRKYHMTCMSLQIGGQRYSLKAPNGVVLNTTMSVPDGCSVIDNSENLAQLEQEFRTELQNALDEQFTTKMAKEMGQDIIDNKVKGIRTKSRTLKFTRAQKAKYGQLLAAQVQKALLKIQHGYAANLLRAGGYEIKTVFDNLYSSYIDKWLINFNGSQSYNIIDAMVGRLTTQDLRRSLDRAQSDNEAAEIINKFLSQKISIIIPETSVSSFLRVVPSKDKPTTSKNWDWKSPSEPAHYASESNDVYGQSFRRRAYWYFRKAVKACWKDNPDKSYGQMYAFGEDTIQRVITYRLANALHRYYKNLKVQYILDNWPEYLHSMLTIYTKNNGVTIGGQRGILEVIDGVPLLITDQANEFEVGNQQITTILAYRFSPETAKAIQEYWDKNVTQLEFF